MLANPLYAGRVRHKGEVYPGQHAAIVDAELWQAVQDGLATNASATKSRVRAGSPSPLAGKLVDPDGRKRVSEGGKAVRFAANTRICLAPCDRAARLSCGQAQATPRPAVA